jgi:hypothetical protein
MSNKSIALVVTIAAIAAFALPTPALANCDLSGPAMLDLYLAGREIGDAVRAASTRSDTASALDAANSALNTNIWGLYWISLYSRRLHEVLEQVDAGREVSPIGSVRGYYSRWDASQLVNSATLALRSARDVDDALTRAEAAATIPVSDDAKLRQYVARVGKELQGCTR